MSNIEQQWANIELGNSLRDMPTTTDETITPDTLTSKLFGLEQARQQKIENLGPKTYGSMEEFAGTLAKKNASGANYDSAEELQFNLGQIANYVLQTDQTTGQRFYNDSQGNRVDYNGKGIGLYMAPGNLEDSYKLGLRAEGKSFKERYTPDIWQYLPFGKGYGWKPGKDGVNPDNVYMDIEVPEMLGREFEKYVHSNAGQLAERTVGQGPISQEWENRLGSGKSEYVRGNAPLYNIDYDVAGVKLEAGTPLPGQTHVTDKFDAEGNYIKPDTDGYFGNLIDAAQYGLGSAAARVGDSAGDLLSRTAKEVYKALPRNATEEQASLAIGKALQGVGYDKNGNFTALDKYKNAEEYGYDQGRITAYVDEVKTTIGDPKATLLDKALVLFKGIKHGPEVLTSSFGDMLLGMTGAPGLALMATGAANEILAERAINKGTTDLDVSDYGIGLATGVIYAAANTFTKGNQGFADTSKTIIEAAKHMDGPAFAAVVGKLTKNGLGEGLEEVFQGATEVVGQKLFTPKEDEILTKETALELTAQGALGFGGGVTGAVAGEVKPAGIVSAIKETTANVLNKEPKSTVIEEEPEVLIGKDVDTVLDQADKVFAVVDDVKVSPSEKIAALRELEEQAYRIEDKDPAKESLLEAIKAEKARFAKKIEETDDVTEYTKVLGSKQGFLDLLDDVMEGTDNVLSEKLETNLKKIAESFGITDEQFTKIKKDYETVELEATKSSKGYLTQGKALRNILSNENPDVRKAEKLLNRMRNFEKSQTKWLENYENTLSELERTVTEYNSDIKKGLSNTSIAPKQTKIPNTTSTLNVKELSDGTYAVDFSGIDQIKLAKERNIKGIRAEIAKSKELLSKAGIKQATTGVQEEAIIDTESISNKGLKSAVESVKRDIEKNKVNSIIVSDTRSERDNYIIRDNEQITNKGEYSENDIVTVLVPDIKTQKDFDKFLKSVRSKKNPFRKEIMAAQEGNATIILDKSLKEYESKPAKKFKYTTVNGKTVNKSVREAIIMQMNRFADDKYAPTHFGSRVFKPVGVVVEEKKIEKVEKTEKEALANKRIEVLNKVFEEYVKNDKIMYTEEVQEYFKNKNKLESYLEYRLEKEVSQYVEISIKAERLSVQSKNLKAKAETAENIDSSAALLKASQEAEKKGKLELAKLKGLEVVKDKASEVLADIDTSKKSGRDLLTKYKEALELDRINGTNTAEELMGSQKQDLIKDILTDSVSKGSRQITINDNDYITDLSKVVKRVKPSIFDIVEVEDMFDGIDTESGASISSEEYIADAKKFLQSTISTAKVSKKYGDLTELELTLANSPAYGLIFSKDGINDSVVMAMKLGLDEYISYKGRVLNPNFKTKEEVAQMVGVLDSQLGKEQFTLLKDKGVFKKTMDNELGKAIMGKLGLGKVAGIEDEVYNRLVAEVGQIATMIGINDGILVNDEITVEEYSKAIAKDNPTESAKVHTKGFKDEAVIRFVKFKTDKKGKLPESIEGIAETYEAIHELIADDSTFRKEPYRRPIDKKYRRNTREQVAKDTTGAKIPSNNETFVSAQEAIDNLVDMVWEYDVELIKEVNSLDRDVLKKWLGFKTEEELENMTYETREASIASNMDIEKNLEELLKLIDSKEKNKLFFDWFYSSNGRYMMDSNTINPQTEKQLHRWLVTPSKHKLDYEYKEGQFTANGKDVTAEVKYALAQSMGFAVDKKSTTKINEFADALLLMSKEEILEVKKKLFEEGEEATINGITIEPEHIGHTLQGFKFLSDAKKGKFSSSLSAEFDAVTSGFGLKLLQLPILKGISKEKLGNISSTMWYWLNKVGIFQAGNTKGIDSMNDILDSTGFYKENERFYDSYQSLAVDMKIDEAVINDNAKKSIYKGGKFTNVKTIYLGLKDVMPVLDADGAVSKALRNLFKDPFMTFNYSAGIRSIRASLSYKMMNDLLDGIASEKPEYNNATKFLAKQIGMHSKTFVMMLRSEPVTSIKSKEGITLESILLKTFDSTYGAKVEEIMTNNFKEFMDAHKQINAAFRATFEMFNNRYKAKLAEVPKGELTIEKKLEIIEELRKDFPVIKGPLSRGVEDGIHIYTTTSVTPSVEEERQAPAQTHVKTKTGVEQEKARFMVREFEAAISSGSVVPIHYIDGAIMAQLLGKGSAITAIHDAIIPPLDRARETIKTYNENMIKIGKEYSVINAINEMLSRPEYSKEEIDKANETKISVQNKEGEYEDIGIGTYFNLVKQEFRTLSTKVTKAREDLATEMDSGVLVGHMAGFPGSMWTNIEQQIQEEVKEEPAIMTKLDKIQQKLGALFPVSAETEQVLNSMSDEQIDALIEQIECKG